MLFSLFKRSLVLITLVAATFATAQATDILSVLKESRPDLEFGELKPSVIEGYNEVRTGGATLYVSVDGNHFFVGELISLTNNEIVSETEKSLASERLEILALAELEELVIFSAEGERKGVINVFTDVTCPYCKRIHDEVPALNAAGVEVRYFAWPRTGLGTLEALKNTTTWCADDPAAMMTAIKDDLFKGDDIACADNPISKHYYMGIQLGVGGTPAVILEDGTLVPGYRPAEQFLELLQIDP